MRVDENYLRGTSAYGTSHFLPLVALTSLTVRFPNVLQRKSRRSISMRRKDGLRSRVKALEEAGGGFTLF